MALAVLTVLTIVTSACADAEGGDFSADSSTTTSTSPPSTSIVTSTSTSTPTPTSPEEPVGNLLFTVDAQLEGALLGFSTGLSSKERASRFRAIERDAGRRYDIGHVFHAWDKAIPTADDLMHLEEDRLLMISWNGTDTKEIAAGQHDDWIRTQAIAVRDLEQPVLLRWLWEMDGNRRRAWVHSGPDYIAAWMHIRGIFDEVEAHNASFVWCPNESLFWEDGDPDVWYPGDANVDWLCADGYNWGDTTTSPEWVSLDEIFGDFVEWASPRGRPIMIGEMGVGEAEPGAKAAWLREIPRVLRTELPDIDAVVYFDKDFSDVGHADWRVDTSAASYAAWIEISNDPWLNPLDR